MEYYMTKHLKCDEPMRRGNTTSRKDEPKRRPEATHTASTPRRLAATPSRRSVLARQNRALAPAAIWPPTLLSEIIAESRNALAMRKAHLQALFITCSTLPQ